MEPVTEKKKGWVAPDETKRTGGQKTQRCCLAKRAGRGGENEERNMRGQPLVKKWAWVLKVWIQRKRRGRGEEREKKNAQEESDGSEVKLAGHVFLE